MRLGISSVDEQEGLQVFHAGTKVTEGGQVVTSGGRVLGVVAVAKTLTKAIERATDAAANIRFEGCFYRSDIGKKTCAR